MLSSNQVEQVVIAIYRTEGGSKTRYPYGIKSIKNCHNPHDVCFNTINNFIISHHIVSVDKYFIYALADKYCPPKDDKQGNINWKHNMIRILHL